MNATRTKKLDPEVQPLLEEAEKYEGRVSQLAMTYVREHRVPSGYYKYQGAMFQLAKPVDAPTYVYGLMASSHVFEGGVAGDPNPEYYVCLACGSLIGPKQEDYCVNPDCIRRRIKFYILFLLNPDYEACMDALWEEGFVYQPTTRSVMER